MTQTQVTITLSDDLYEHAQRWAAITRKGLDETLTNALAIVLTPVYSESRLDQPVEGLSDNRLLATVKVRMQPEQGRRLEELLALQREGRLSIRQHNELQALMQVYDQLWLRQSEALAEAVRRGLIDPMKL